MSRYSPIGSTAALAPPEPPTSTSVQADLTLSKVAKPETVKVGEPVTFTLTVKNLGPDAAEAVVVSDTLPATATETKATPTAGACDPVNSGTLTCQLGDLASGATATVEVSVTAASQGALTNSASVKADTDDPDEANNRAAVDAAVNGQMDLPPSGNHYQCYPIVGEGELTF